MKADRRWWNDGRYAREVAEFTTRHGKLVPRPIGGRLTQAEREFVRRLIRMELEAYEPGRD